MHALLVKRADRLPCCGSHWGNSTASRCNRGRGSPLPMLGGAVTIEAAQEQLSDLTGTPVRLVALEADDEVFDLAWGGAGWRRAQAGGPVGEGLKAVLFVAIERSSSRFASDTELRA